MMAICVVTQGLVNAGGAGSAETMAAAYSTKPFWLCGYMSVRVQKRNQRP